MQALRRTGSGFPWMFFVLTYGISWILWAIVIADGGNAKTTWLFAPYMIGGFSPSIVGIIMVYRRLEAAERRFFWKSLVSFKSISAGSYAFIILLAPVVFALSLVTDWLVAGGMPDYSILLSIGRSPVQIIPVLIIGLFFGSLSEELGWRGFALDRIQSLWNPLVSSLVLGLFWLCWHVPLFFMNGTTQHEWGFGSIGFIGFLFFVLSFAVIITLVYNRSGRSLLSAVLLHAAYNITVNLVPVSGRASFSQGVLFLIVAAAMVLMAGRAGRSPVAKNERAAIGHVAGGAS
jgi:membrane protease YdiL (CAAX protease family)